MTVFTSAIFMLLNRLLVCHFRAHAVVGRASFQSSLSNWWKSIYHPVQPINIIFSLSFIDGTGQYPFIWYFYCFWVFSTIMSLYCNQAWHSENNVGTVKTKLRMTFSCHNLAFITSTPVRSPLDQHYFTLPANQDAGIKSNVHILCLGWGLHAKSKQVFWHLYCCTVNFNLGSLQHMQTPRS